MIKTIITHTRQIDNFIRKQLVAGLSISVPENLDTIITSFLAQHQTDAAGGMTYETVAFFLQALNTHGLYEQLDNKKFAVLFPTYIPFDVEAVAARFGFPELYKTMEINLMLRSKAGVKQAQLSNAWRDAADNAYETFEKVAELNTREVQDEYKESRGIYKRGRLSDAKLAAAGIYWSFSNMDDFVAGSVTDRRYLSVIDGLKCSSVRGAKDKKASVSDFKNFLTALSDIVKYSK